MLNPKVLKTMALVTQIGISMLAPILVMLFLGVRVDEYFSTQSFPVFILLGIAAGFRNTYILIMNAMIEGRKEKGNHEKTEK